MINHLLDCKYYNGWIYLFQVDKSNVVLTNISCYISMWGGLRSIKPLRSLRRAWVEWLLCFSVIPVQEFALFARCTPIQLPFFMTISNDVVMKEFHLQDCVYLTATPFWISCKT